MTIFCGKAIGRQLALASLGAATVLGRPLKTRENSRDHVIDLATRQGPADFQYNAQRDDDVTIRPNQIVSHLLGKADKLLSGFGRAAY